MLFFWNIPFLLQIVARTIQYTPLFATNLMLAVFFPPFPYSYVLPTRIRISMPLTVNLEPCGVLDRAAPDVGVLRPACDLLQVVTDLWAKRDHGGGHALPVRVKGELEDNIND